MKNFPNQFTSFATWRAILAAVQDMTARGMDVTDARVVGYDLVRRGLKGFQDLPAGASVSEVEARIAREQSRPSQDQTPLVAVREVRRTLAALGWADEQLALTPAGEALLASATGSSDERRLLREALLNLELTDATHPTVSHPVRTLLQLLAHAPTRLRSGLELALEPEDDSEAERDRVLALYDEVRPFTRPQRAAMLGESLAKVDNNVKLLPTLAREAGLVIEDDASEWTLAREGWIALGLTPPEVIEEEATPPELPERSRALTRGTARSLADLAAYTESAGVPTELTPEQQAIAKARLAERTRDHQNLVRRFAALAGSVGELYEDRASYDLVWVDSSGAPHLFEMKTIAGDADAQVIKAIGQLRYYAHFNVVAKFRVAAATSTLVVDVALHPDLYAFLEAHGIGVLVCTETGQTQALNPSGQAVLDLLPPS